MLSLISKIYGAAVERRNRKFESGEIPQIKCEIPVVSVGNLSVGGSGKTPFAIFLVHKLKESGFKPGVIGRGYRKKKKGTVIVRDEDGRLAGAAKSGDEMRLIADKAEVPTIADEKKYRAAKEMENRFDVDCIVVDDGFQHRYLKRDFDIVLLENSDFERPFCIPKGRLREPLSALRRADAIVVKANFEHSDKIESLAKGGVEIAKIKPEFGEPKDLFGEQTFDFRKRVVAVSGIARPKMFFDTLEKLGIKVDSAISYGDHADYDETKLRRIASVCRKSEVDIVIATEKDAVKLIESKTFFEVNCLKCYVLPMNFVFFENGNGFMNLMLKNITKKKNEI